MKHMYYWQKRDLCCRISPFPGFWRTVPCPRTLAHFCQYVTWGKSLPSLSFFMCKAEIPAAEMLYKQATLCFCTLVEVRTSPLLKKQTYSIALYWCWTLDLLSKQYCAGFPYDSILCRYRCNQAWKLLGPFGCWPCGAVEQFLVYT